MGNARRADLAEFLRARRHEVEPAAVGFAAGGRRRTAGLRREEVAMLAGVSVSWYTWLEQGRPINASLDVLDALARALQLDPIEREHLLQLAGHPLRRPITPGQDAAPPGVIGVLTALEPSPAYVLGPRWDVLAWNRPQALLYPQFETLPAEDRNLVWVMFGEPAARALNAEWENEARRVLSQFRADTTPFRHDPAVVALVERLSAESEEFAAWWPRHDVAGFEEHERVFQHPVAGRLRFRTEQLTPTGHPDLRIVVHLPIEGDASTERLTTAGR